MSETIKVIRHTLGSVDLSDLDDKDLSAQERKDYIAAIHAVYPRLERDLKKFMYQQLLFNSKESQTWDQVIFGRGVFDGFALVLEHWKLAHQEFINNSTDGEFNKFAAVPEI